MLIPDYVLLNDQTSVAKFSARFSTVTASAQKHKNKHGEWMSSCDLQHACKAPTCKILLHMQADPAVCRVWWVSLVKADMDR